MLNPNEAVVLTGLRKTTLAYLSESEYTEILKSVEKGGIQSLTGTASMIVKSAVLKHGSHNQKTHGGKGGGGKGGGNSGASAPSGMTEKEFAAANKIALSSGSEAGSYLESVEEKEAEWLENAGAVFDGDIGDMADVDMSGVSRGDKKIYSDFKLGQEQLSASLISFSQARKSPVSSTKRSGLEKGYEQFGQGIALTSGIMSNAETSGAENALSSLGQVINDLGGETE